jgi:nicotinate-nucleotide pyrophosphorylase (carboxylating)
MSPVDLNALSLDGLFEALVHRERLHTLLRLALDEDLGDVGDVTTSALVPPDTRANAAIVARDQGVVAGLPVVEAILEMAGAREALGTRVLARDGQECRRGDLLVQFDGPLAVLLPLERTMLNALGRLCGIASLTRRFVHEAAGTKARVCCTRKTLPGWRELDKYAVRCGGGWLHRIGLYDAMLVKDNHLGAVPPGELGSALAAAARVARRRHDLRFVEVEVDSLEQLRVVLKIERGLIDIVLLDNFDVAMLREAVALRSSAGASVELEASGGVRLDTVRPIAATGVDRISTGAITHSAIALDVAIDLLPPAGGSAR